MTRFLSMFNADMSSERVTVEWGFGKIAALWPWVDYRKNMKVLLQPVGMFLRVANVLTTMHTCMYGSEVSNHFGMDPPSLSAFMSGGPF